MHFALKLGLALVVMLACGDAEEPLTVEEQQQKFRDEGEYCCTRDGKSEDPVRCAVKPGASYLQDFSNVDASGRGEECGWVVSPK